MRTEMDVETTTGRHPIASASTLPEAPSAPARTNVGELLEVAKGAIGRSMSGDSPAFLERNCQKGGE